MGHQGTSGIDHGDVIGDIELDRFALAGGNDAPGVLQG
jgi:hypothetical protein